jgi:osmotically-inducible protein OsmY
MLIMRRLFASLLLGSLGLLAGCGIVGSGSTGSTESSASAGRPSDSQITSQIQSAFQADDTLAAANIEVSVSDGVVTLSGRVPDARAFNRAISLARVPGYSMNSSNLKYSQ